MSDLTEDEKRRVLEVYDDLGYEPPDNPTIQDVRMVLAEAITREDAEFSLELVEGIADLVFEALPEADDDESDDDAEEDDAP